MPSDSVSMPLPSAPYRGIEPFRFIDRPIFAAREKEVQKLIRLITIYRGILFYGDSGVGKSSLINAGLIPALQNEGFRAERFRVQPFAGQELLLERISLSGGEKPPFQPSSFTQQVSSDETEPARVVWPLEDFGHRIEALRQPESGYRGRNLEGAVVLIFDQFEEIVSLVEETSDSREKFNQARVVREQIVKRLLALLGDADLPLKLIFSFREDYLAKIFRCFVGAPALRDQTFRLTPLPETELRTIIRWPFESPSIPLGHFKRRLSDRACDALESAFEKLSEIGNINLTEVQIACLALWEDEAEEKRFIEEQDHREAVRRLFGNYLDRALNRLGQNFRAPAIAALTRLVTSGGTRNIVSEDNLLNDLRRHEHVPEADAHAVLKALADTTRLILRQARGDTAFYEITSEFLIPWIREKRQAQEQAEAMKRAAEEAERLEHRAKEVNDLLSQANFSLARYSHQAGNEAEALAHCAEALRLNPGNHAGAAYTATLLAQTNWPVPLADLMRHDSAISSAEFSPDGRRMVTAYDGIVRILDAASGEEICKPLKHQRGIISAQFSPDGQRVITVADTAVWFWKAASGAAIGQPLHHRRRVTSVEFSPDGRWVVTTAREKTAWLWEAESGKKIGKPLEHKDWVTFARFSPDGQWVITISDDPAVQLWRVATGEKIPLGRRHPTNFAQFSPDGQRAITVADTTARLWDAANGEKIGKPLKHRRRIISARFSPDGQRVVTASYDYTARLWETESGKPISKPLRHEYWVFSAEFSPDGQRVVTASADGTARLLDALNGKEIGEPLRYGGQLICARFSPDGQRVVTGSGDGTAQLWDAASGKEIGEPMKQGRRELSARFSLDGQRVITCSEDGVTRLWVPAIGEAIDKPLQHRDEVTSAQFSPDGQRVVTASRDKTARLWDVASRKEVGKRLQHEDKVTSAYFSPDGQRVVTASRDKTARLWDVASREQIGEPMKHEDEVTCAQFSPDGQRVVTASVDNTARLWDMVSREQIGEAIDKPLQHGDVVNSAQFSPDGRWVVTASRDKTARLWDAASGKQVCELKHRGWVGSAQFSPRDGKRVVTASKEDEMARLWDAASGEQIRELKHRGWVGSAQFSPPGGKRVVTTLDCTARLWDTASGKEIGELLKHGDVVHSAQFCPDGQRVVTASADWTARLWNVPAISDEDTAKDVLLLADLAKASGGLLLQSSEQLEFLNVPASEVREIRKKIAARFSETAAELTPLQRFLNWSVSDPRTRTISPFLEVTVGQWVEEMIKEGTLDGLRAAIQVDPANARLAAHFGRALADCALARETDPDAARRARGEADFQTHRALELARDNNEVKKLRAEVAKLLQLRSE